MNLLSAAGSAASLAMNFLGAGGGGSSGDDGSGAMQGILDKAQKQYIKNFEMTEQQAMIDNTNSTYTTIASGHQQEAAGAAASARTVGEGNAHIMA